MGSDEYVQWTLGHRAFHSDQEPCPPWPRVLASWITGVCLVCTFFSLEVMSLCTEGWLFTVLRFPLHVQFIVGLLIGISNSVLINP